jgi:hypothetical protein
MVASISAVEFFKNYHVPAVPELAAGLGLG